MFLFVVHSLLTIVTFSINNIFDLWSVACPFSKSYVVAMKCNIALSLRSSDTCSNNIISAIFVDVCLVSLWVKIKVVGFINNENTRQNEWQEKEDKYVSDQKIPFGVTLNIKNSNEFQNRKEKKIKISKINN